MCPACGTPYNANVSKTGLIPANHLWHLEAAGEAMLTMWPETLEEKAINEAAMTMAEHAAKVRFTDLTREQLHVKIGSVVATHSIKMEKFTTMKLDQKVISAVENLSAHRGAKRHPYNWDHIKNGYKGSFYKYIKDETPRHEV